MSSSDVVLLQNTWRQLYTKQLPELARGKHTTQSKWPVSLDHCFARIILDNTVGAEAQSFVVPWDTVIPKPAIRHMSRVQLQRAIDLGQRIARGEVNLLELDRMSLEGRGKATGKYGAPHNFNTTSDPRLGISDSIGSKRAQIALVADDIVDGDPGSRPTKKPRREKPPPHDVAFSASQSTQSPVCKRTRTTDPYEHTDSISVPRLECDLGTTSNSTLGERLAVLDRIDNDKSLTPFRKKLYTALLSVPRGEFTTYAALAKYLGSAARAVGSGMRNNPFAPNVPCHRVLASDRTIGGFGGDWTKSGEPTQKQYAKKKLLEAEGVKFTSNGKAQGLAWFSFRDRNEQRKGDGSIIPNGTVRNKTSGLKDWLNPGL